MNARHIVHIREALWKQPERGACVMVGAGLSRQPDSGESAEPRPPSWGDLADRLQEELGCGKPGGRKTRPTEAVTARDCPRLAQQYKATFGQSALDAFLLDHVPDGEPGEVHKRLLRLPWADVFTTNWDTLLEKAAKAVSDRTYDPVLSSADLATTVAPRIVKLHGSFPSNRPFVITEEDYRIYPTRFAPLVNTVQQALMESIFLLVGFSGDDPNFLHWCGWVRDHLGPAAPRLYLANYLDLDRPTRLMLEERGVVPIDLAPELAEVSSREARYRAATEWILLSLEAGQTQEQRWPFRLAAVASAATPGIPAPVPPAGQPREAPGAPSQGANAEAVAEQVQKVSAIWRRNRTVYPGWPILPFSKHSHLFAYTTEWVKPMLRALPDLDPRDRLSVARELIERIELLMDPLAPELAKAATEALAAIERHMEENAEISEEEENAIQEDRVALMLAVLTDSRYELDEAKFEEWSRRLNKTVRFGTPAFHRLHHEQCLWEFTRQDFARLAERLNAWSTEGTDPMWSLRKAALLVESGDVDGGRDLAIQTLQRAERAWARDSRVLTASRLGWARYWRHAEDWAHWWDQSWQDKASSHPDTDLWARLAPHDADARSDLDAYVRKMTREQREESPWTFDLGRVHSFTLSNPEAHSFRCAWRVIRLLELSGLPSGIPRVRIANDHIERAARLIAPFLPAYAARLLLISGSRNEKALNAVLSRTQIACMSDQETSSLLDAAQRARDHFLRRWIPAVGEEDFLRQRVENAIEITSRCVVRHGVGRASEIFEWALQYRRPRRWVDNQFWSCIAGLWKRSWEAMNLESRKNAVLVILRAPVPEDALPRESDPGDLLLDKLPRIKRTDADEAIWASCVQQICSGLRGGEYARMLAFDRLNPIARRHLLSQAEEQEVAASLWGDVDRESIELPRIGPVDDWVYLLLPEPEPGIAERCFRVKWIGRNATGATAEKREETIRNVAAAWSPDQFGARAIQLSEHEEEWFWQFVETWFRDESTQRLVRGTSNDRAVHLLVDVLTHRRAPTSVLHRLAESVSAIPGRRLRFAEQWGSPNNEYLMIAASAALGGSDTGEAEHRIRLGARSPDARVSLAAWHALQWWIRTSGSNTAVSLCTPSVEIVRDIGVAIGTSQQAGLVGALGSGCAVYRSRNPKFIEAIHAQVILGLEQLQSELDYRASVGDRRIADELPLRRHWCVSLAWAMKDAGKGDDEVVGSWIKAADSDPLWLVRCAREWYVASHADEDTEGI